MVKSLLLLFSVVSSLNVEAQLSTIPVVTIHATDPLATWAGDTGRFTVVRDGPTNQSLNVFYLISGSASNGVDYASIGNLVMIPAGVRTNAITISPINLGQTNIETVILKLSPSPLAIPQNYEIGLPDVATVYITPAGVTNIPPVVKIFSPTNGTILTAPVDVGLGALASDPDGSVSTVEFFANDQSLGIVTNGAILDPPFPDGTGPGTRGYFLLWTKPAPGTYALTAKATDNGGASTVSAIVNLTILQGPPPTNVPPVVKIALPSDGEKFYAPVDVPICASAFDPDGFVTTVEFFAGDESLGIKTNNPVSAGPMNPFCLLWSNVPPGDYSLTAIATDNGGASSTSAPVHIVVALPPPPPSNFPPIVRITSPPNGAQFLAPLDLPLYAYAAERGGSIGSVEFFAGTNSLGLAQGLCLRLGDTNQWPIAICPTNLFLLVWSNPPVGPFAMTAVATDNQGTSVTSAPVNITIVSAPPPPTNRPTIVNIVASDPLAIEGTNCWQWLGLTDGPITWNHWMGGTSIWRFFTNCGPKNATFTVHRSGSTNEDLTVVYDVGGTATNGVDYVPLSGSVVIPAGQRVAEVTIVPLDDGPPDINSTVVIKLSGSTNYIVGFPNKAAVLILDSVGPFPSSGFLSDHSFHLDAPGPDGAWFHIDYSTNLLNWTSICTNQVINGSIDFIDPDAASDSSRFYRTVPQAAGPTY